VKNPFLNREEKKARTGPAYKRSKVQEKESAKRIGGRQISGSGKGWKKGDTEIPNLARLECKSTAADSFRVTKGMFDTLEIAGRLAGQLPIMDIEFIDAKQVVLDAYCVIKRKDLYDLLERLTDAEGQNSGASNGSVRGTKPIGYDPL